MKKFRLQVSIDVVLDEKQIWPDGDMPEGAASSDAMEALRESHHGDILQCLSEWNLANDTECEFTIVPGGVVGQ